MASICCTSPHLPLAAIYTSNATDLFHHAPWSTGTCTFYVNTRFTVNS